LMSRVYESRKGFVDHGHGRYTDIRWRAVEDVIAH
jgi:hypothetical protein